MVRFYLGISPITKRFPQRAWFSFIIYRHDPKWGFRAAAKRYYEFFPDDFKKRAAFEGYLNYAGLEPCDDEGNLHLRGATLPKVMVRELVHQAPMKVKRSDGAIAISFTIEAGETLGWESASLTYLKNLKLTIGEAKHLPQCPQKQNQTVGIRISPRLTKCSSYSFQFLLGFFCPAIAHSPPIVMAPKA